MGFGVEQMFDVVQDVERYQDFLPWCHSSKVTSRRKDLLTANLEVGIPPVVESYTSNVTLIRPYTIKAVSTEGKLFKELINIWKFSPGLKGTPNSCIIDFYVSFELRSALASQFSSVFFNEVVRAMTGAFYNEAKRRYGQESVPSRKIEIIPSNSNNDGRKT